MSYEKIMFKLASLELNKIHQSIEDRVDLREVHSEILRDINKPITKIAFDTRRIDQYSDYNPRRNLQYYHRSDAFIDGNASDKIKMFFKLKTAVDSIKDDFLGDPVWLDSYARILSSALDRTLRLDQKDMDFFKPQMDYLEELLYLRYRLKNDDIIKLNEQELRNIVLSRDDRLMHKQIYSNYNNGGLLRKSDNNSTHELQSASSKEIKNSEEKTTDSLIKTLFGDVKASKENKEIERSVSIIIKDKIIDNIKKES